VARLGEAMQLVTPPQLQLAPGISALRKCPLSRYPLGYEPWRGVRLCTWCSALRSAGVSKRVSTGVHAWQKRDDLYFLRFFTSGDHQGWVHCGNPLKVASPRWLRQRHAWRKIYDSNVTNLPY